MAFPHLPFRIVVNIIDSGKDSLEIGIEVKSESGEASVREYVDSTLFKLAKPISKPFHGIVTTSKTAKVKVGVIRLPRVS